MILPGKCMLLRELGHTDTCESHLMSCGTAQAQTYSTTLRWWPPKQRKGTSDTQACHWYVGEWHHCSWQMPKASKHSMN